MKIDFSNSHVLTIGDSMVDEYVYGEITRISPEAPVPILNKLKTKWSLGGAGNVAKNVKTLGAKSSLITLLGKDELAQIFAVKCKEFNIELSQIIDKNRPTSLKSRYIAQEQQILRIDNEISTIIQEGIIEVGVEILMESLAENSVDVILIQDYNKGFLSPKFIRHIIRIASLSNIRTVVDPKHENILSYRGCFAIKPNIHELKHFVSTDVEITSNSLEKSVQKLQDALEVEECYVTLGKYGLYNHQIKEIIPSYNIEVSDVTGAGDSVLAVLGLAISKSYKQQDINKLCIGAGAITVSKHGCHAINIDELKKVLTDNDSDNY